MTFDQLARAGQGYRKRRLRVGGGGGPTALNLGEPIGVETLGETQESVQKRAAQVYDMAVARGANPNELERIAKMATGEANAPGPLDVAFNLLAVPGDLLRLGVMDAVPGGVNPTADDYQDIISLNKQRMIERHLADPNSEWGRSGEMRGTDLLDRLGFGYEDKEQEGIWDELKRGVRFVGATAIDIFTDPVSYVTGGGAGVARAAATEAAETIVTQTVKNAARILVKAGDDVLERSVDDILEAGTSPLVREAAVRIQTSARALKVEPGQGARSARDLIDDVSGVISAEEFRKPIIAGAKAEDIKVADAGLDDLDDLVAGRAETAAKRPTVWNEMVTDIGTTVARKQFHRDGDLWAAYTRHVLDYMPERVPAAVGSIGGLSFQVPFLQGTARHFGGVTKATQGMTTRVTREIGGKLPSLEKIGTSKAISRIRSKYQDIRKTKGRQAGVVTLRDRTLTPARRAEIYTGIVAVHQGTRMIQVLTNQLRTASMTSSAGIDVTNRLNKLFPDEKLRAQADLRVGQKYIKGAEDITTDSFSDLGVTLSKQDAEYLDTMVKGLRRLQEKGERVMDVYDPEFRQMRANSDRTYTSLQVKDDIEDLVVENKAVFDELFDEFDAFASDAKALQIQRAVAEGQPSLTDFDQILADFAGVLGARIGMDLNADDISMFLTFLNGFRRVRMNRGLQEIGSRDVLKLRTLGGTARVIEEAKPGGGVRLRTVQDFNDLSLMNEKMTRLFNRYMPEGLKVDAVFETRSAALVEHWFNQVHAATAERLLFDYMIRTGHARVAEQMITDVARIANRLARNEVVTDGLRIVEDLMNMLHQLENGVMPDDPAILRNLAEAVELKYIPVQVGGTTIDIPWAAAQDLEVQRGLSQANAYLSMMKNPTTRARKMKNLQALIGSRMAVMGDMGDDTGVQIQEMFNAALRSEFKRYRQTIERGLYAQVEREYSQAEALLEGVQADARALKALRDRLMRERRKVKKQLDALDEAFGEEAKRINEDALASAQNATTRNFAASIRKNRKGVVIDASIQGETYLSPEDFGRVFDGVTMARAKKVEDLYAVRDSSPAERRPVLGVEANEFRRIAEGIETIPITHVSREGTGGVTDAGFAIPNAGSADVWIEYYPGFGGGGYSKERGMTLSRIWPEADPKKIDGRMVYGYSEGFPKAMGWSPNGGSKVADWWEDNFVPIGYGVWKYVGASNRPPLYILSTTESIGTGALQDELTHLWHAANHDVASDESFRPLRVFGLESTGMRHKMEPFRNTPLYDAINRVRARAAGQPVGRRGPDPRSTRYVDVLELYEETIQAQVSARGINTEDRIAFNKAMDRERKKLPLSQFLSALEDHITRRPRYITRVERLYDEPLLAGDPTMARIPLAQRGPDRPRFGRVHWAQPQRMSEEDIVMMRVSAHVPRAHRYNLNVARVLGLEGYEDLSPEQLLVELDAAIARGQAEGMEMPERMIPWEEDLIPGTLVFNRNVARAAGSRFHYDPDYVNWLTTLGASMGMIPDPAIRQGGYQLQRETVAAFEDQIEELLQGQRLDLLYGDNPIGFEELPWLPPDVELVVREAYAKHFPKPKGRTDVSWQRELNQLDPYQMMLRLRGIDWTPDNGELLEYHEAIRGMERGMAGYYEGAEDVAGDFSEMRMGESFEVGEELQRLSQDEERVALVEELKAKWPRLRHEYKEIIDRYRADGRPQVTDTDNRFWAWLEKRYPGTQRNLTYGGKDAPIASAERFGRRLLEIERQAFLKNKPAPGSTGYTEWLQKSRDWESTFAKKGESPEQVWIRFYGMVQGKAVHPDLAPLVAEYADMVEARGLASEMTEKDLVVAWWTEDTLADHDPLWIQTVVDDMAAKDGQARVELSIAEPLHDSDRAANDVVWRAQDMEALQGMLRGMDDDVRNYDDLIGQDEANEYLDILDPGGATQAPLGEEMKRGVVYGAGLKPREELFIDGVRGDLVVDMDSLDVGQYDTRFFPSRYEPRGSVGRRGFSHGMVNDVNLADSAASAQPVSFRHDPVKYAETGERVPLLDSSGNPVPWRADTTGGQDPYGMDELIPGLDAEFGEYQGIRLDPRTKSEEPPRPFHREIAVETQAARGEPQTFTGFSDNMSPGDKVEAFVTQQVLAIGQLGRIRFSPRSYRNEMRRLITNPELEAMGTELLRLYNLAPDNWKKRAVNYARVDLDRALKAWNAFKASGNDAFLEDMDLRTAFAISFASRTQDLDKAVQYKKALQAAAIDKKVVDVQGPRSEVRKILGVEAEPISSDDDIVARAATRRATTISAGVDGQTHRNLTEIARLGRKGPIPTGPAPPPTLEGDGVTKVISGGQMGADRIGLEQARNLGIETGGMAPKGWRTEAGPAPDLADYGLSEATSSDYMMRTRANIDDSDGTVIFTTPGGSTSPGTRRTMQYARQRSKPYIVNPTPDQMRDWVRENGIKTLNVAGNRVYDDAANIEAVLRAASYRGPAAGEMTTTGFGRTGGVNVGRTTSGGVTGPRSGKSFGNPFPAKKGETTDESVARYAEWLDRQVAEDPLFAEDVADLSGKHLLCPGRKHDPCHAQVLAEKADELAQARPVLEVGAAVDVGRHSNKGIPNYGNPFYFMEKKGIAERYRNKVHPTYRRRVIKANDVGVVEATWEPVPYTLVSSREEANARFTEMLWDMIEDPEFGPGFRQQILEELQGKVLFQYETGGYSYRQAKAADARTLADAVDWLSDGMLETAGRPFKNGPPSYITDEERKILEGLMAGADYDAVDAMYTTFRRQLDPADLKEAEIQEEQMLSELEKQKSLVETVYEGSITDRRSIQELTAYRQEVQSWRSSVERVLNDLGISEDDEIWWNLNQAYDQTGEHPILTMMTQAVRRTHGPYAVLKQEEIPIEEGGGFFLRVDMPEGEPSSFLSRLDTKEINEARGYTGAKPVPVSLTFKELDEMGERKAKEQGFDLLYELSQGWRTKTKQVDDLTTEIDHLAQKQKASGLRPEDQARLDEATAARETAREDASVINRYLDMAWETVLTHDNRRLRSHFNMLEPAGGRKAGQAAPLPSGANWDRLQRAIDSLPEQHRVTTTFLVDSALTSHLFPSKTEWQRWFFDQRNSALSQAKGLRNIVDRTYGENVMNPLLWSTMMSMPSAPTMKVRQLMLDFMQLLQVHGNRGSDELFTEMMGKIGVSTKSNVDPHFGADVMAAGERQTFTELIESIRDAFQYIESDPTIRMLAQNGVLNLDSEVIQRIKSFDEVFRVRAEEKIPFGKGVLGGYVGIAGEQGDKLMNDVVLMEFYRALNRMQLAADPRVGMELLGGASGIKRWWMAAATVARPTFFMRNLIGGLWNNALIGVGPAKAMALMPDVFTYVRNRRNLKNVAHWDEGMEDIVMGYLLEGVSEKNREMMARAIRTGVLDSAFSSTLPRNVSGAYGMRAWNPFQSDNRFFRAGTQAMEFTEGILRLSAFQKFYDPAYPWMTSRLGQLMAEMVHFDYGDLSVFDNYMKQWVPFWVWTSRNLPLQMRYLLGNPRMLVMYNHARENWNEQMSEWDEEEGRWLESGERWVLPFRQEDDMGNWVQLSWEPALPFTDLLATPLFDQMFDDPGAGDLFGERALDVGAWSSWAAGLLAPQYSAINDMAVEPRDQYRTVNAPPLFAPIFRMLGAEATPQGDVRVHPLVNSALQTAIPFYTEYTELMGQPSSSPYNAGNMGMLPEDYMRERQDPLPNWNVAMQRLGRGLGVQWRSPEDVYWMYKDWEAYLQSEYTMERAQLSPP